MIDLDERLGHVARTMTDGLELRDPSVSTARRATTTRRAGAGLALAAAAVLAVVVWRGEVLPPADTVVAGGAALGEPVLEPTAPAQSSPVDRFRAALATALSGGVSVRVEAVEHDGSLPSMPVGSTPLPVVLGPAGAADRVTAIDGPIEASTSSVAVELGPIHLRDTLDGRSYWQVAPGQWQRAAFPEPSLADQLRAFAASSCITAASGRDDAVFITTGPGPCVDDPLTRDGGPDRWLASLDADGRVVSIAPVADLASAEPDLRSQLIFSDHGAVDVELPDLTTVVDVASPQSWGVDASTGWAVLSDALG